MRRFLAGAMCVQRAHVVQAVGQLDQDDAHVARHGQQHLAEVLRLRLDLALEFDFLQLGQAVDEVATGAPKRSISSSFLTSWSSITSCSSAAMMAWASSFQSAQISATAIGWEIYGSPDLRTWPRCISSEKR
jgi:hypothetical protein